MPFLIGLNLMNFPKFPVLFKHITNHEFFVGINHQNDPF